MAKVVVWTPETIVHQKNAPSGCDITYGEISSLLDAGLSDAEIRAHKKPFAFLTKRKMTQIRAYYMMEQQQARRSNGLRVLCDENASKGHLMSCFNVFGLSTSANFAGITSEKDQEVWRHAVDNEIDLIITYDLHLLEKVRDETPERKARRENDLTHIAREAWAEQAKGDYPEKRLPMLVHLTPETFIADVFDASLNKYASDIFNLHANRAAPVLRLSSNGVSIVQFNKAASKGPATREESYAKTYLAYLLPQRSDWSNREDPKIRRLKKLATKGVAVTIKNQAMVDKLQERMERLAAQRGSQAPVLAAA